MLLDADGLVREFQYFAILDAEAGPFILGSRNIASGRSGMAFRIGEAQLLSSERAAQHGAITLLEGRLVHVKLVRIHASLDDVLSQPIDAGNEHHVGESGLGVERKDHAAARAI